jgi:Tfp pilus assembly PilM family ATPase
MTRHGHNAGRCPIGIDLGPLGVRMLQLGLTDTRPNVLAGGAWRSPHDDPASTDALRKSIRQLNRFGHFHGRDAVASVPSDEIHLATARVALKGQVDPALDVMAQAYEAFDFDLSLAQLSVIPAGPILHGEHPEREYILLAVPHAKIETRSALLESCGLRVAAIDPEPLAVFRSFRNHRRRENDRSLTTCIVHIQPRYALVMVAHGPELLLVRQLRHGGNALTEAASANLGLCRADVNLLRSYLVEHHGLDRAKPAKDDEHAFDTEKLFWTMHDALRGQVDELALEVELCLRYCQTNFDCPAIDSLVLSGHDAEDPTVRSILHDRLAMPCGVSSPLRGLETGRCNLFVDRRRAMSHWSLCVGLALREGFDERYDQADSLLEPDLAEVDVDLLDNAEALA